MDTLLDIRQLGVQFRVANRLISALDGVNFSLRRGEIYALVGESGSGKSITALSIMRLLPPAAQLTPHADIQFDGEDLMALPEVEMRQRRGRRISMIFQEPMTSLNPVLTVGEQIDEVLRIHESLNRRQRTEKIFTLLRTVGIPDPLLRYHAYPHQLSGGMRQRVMIALALACQPDLLIADEPTTALDVTIQAQILQLLRHLCHATHMSLLLITHDLGIVKQTADRVGVMYAGHLVEENTIENFFAAPKHPYSQQLLAALPDLERRGRPLSLTTEQVARESPLKGCRFAPRCLYAWERCHNLAPAWLLQEQQGIRCHLYDPQQRPVACDATRFMERQPQIIARPDQQACQELLRVTALSVQFPLRRSFFHGTRDWLQAVSRVNFSLKETRILAIVGESGCGKTTLARAVLRLLPFSGEITFHQNRLDRLTEVDMRRQRRQMQMVFQDPYSAMDPRWMIGDMMAEGILTHEPQLSAKMREKKIRTLLNQVGISESAMYRYPHEFSGGQRQRINIARALSTTPQLLICDEPTSALDVSVQAQILNLLKALKETYRLSYLFITHNIGVVGYFADEVLVMYLGRIVERGDVADVLSAPKHPYTQLLLSAVPTMTSERISTEMPSHQEQTSALQLPTGCHFHPRCPQAMPICSQQYPATTHLTEAHQVDCFLYGKRGES